MSSSNFSMKGEPKFTQRAHLFCADFLWDSLPFEVSLILLPASGSGGSAVSPLTRGNQVGSCTRQLMDPVVFNKGPVPFFPQKSLTAIITFLHFQSHRRVIRRQVMDWWAARHSGKCSFPPSNLRHGVVLWGGWNDDETSTQQASWNPVLVKYPSTKTTWSLP